MRQIRENKAYRRKEVQKDFDKLNFKFAWIIGGAFIAWLMFLIYMLIQGIKLFIL